jgi:hypothetical protein
MGLRESQLKSKDMTPEQLREEKFNKILSVLNIWNLPLLPKEFDNWQDYFISKEFKMTKELMNKMLEYGQKNIVRNLRSKDIIDAIKYLNWLIPKNRDPEYLFPCDILSLHSTKLNRSGGCITKQVRNPKAKETWDIFKSSEPSPFATDCQKYQQAGVWKELIKNEKFQNTLDSLQIKAPVYPGFLYRVETLQRFKAGKVSFRNRSFTSNKSFLNIAKTKGYDDEEWIVPEMKKVWESGNLPTIYFGKGLKGLYLGMLRNEPDDEEEEYLVSGTYKIANIEYPKTSKTRVLTNKFIKVELEV